MLGSRETVSVFVVLRGCFSVTIDSELIDGRGCFSSCFCSLLILFRSTSFCSHVFEWLSRNPGILLMFEDEDTGYLQQVLAFSIVAFL